jgi:CDGSH-type Zn-finger protein
MPEAEVVITVRDNGPLRIRGPITVLDAEGNPFDISGQEVVALCRCGRSGRKPFCDATHRLEGFASTPRA